MVHCGSLSFFTFDCVIIHLLGDLDWLFEQKWLQKMDFGNLSFQRKSVVWPVTNHTRTYSPDFASPERHHSQNMTDGNFAAF